MSTRQTPPTPDPPTSQTVKETLEQIIIAFILAFVFRAYVVEAFVIPTGSMAPTLLGEHLRMSCAQCGYRFTVDRPEAALQQTHLPPSRRGFQAICPMCQWSNVLAMPQQSGERIRPGDRILVHKYIYKIVEPKRWDVVVFKNPAEPEVNYIKRLVGLPDESLWIIEGNVYVNRDPQVRADQWQIARKTDRPKVQRAVWQPIYHSQFVPLDYATRPWSSPWVADQPNNWLLAGRHGYRHLTAAPGKIRFDFNRLNQSQVMAVSYPYNQLKPAMLPEPIEEIRIAAAFQPDAAGLSLTLGTTARLDWDDSAADPVPLVARIEASGQAALESIDPQTGQKRILVQRTLSPLPIGRATEVELWMADQHASLWINGRRELVWEFALSIETVRDRQALPTDHRPEVYLEVSGTPVTLHRVELDRDLYYSSHSPIAGRGHGTRVKRPGYQDGDWITIEQDQYFCLGDNSPSSHDGRYWRDVNYWVSRRFLNQAHNRLGVVPRKLMVGQAFFVYFPAPFSLAPDKPGYFPNIGDMRFIH